MDSFGDVAIQSDSVCSSSEEDSEAGLASAHAAGFDALRARHLDELPELLARFAVRA